MRRRAARKDARATRWRTYQHGYAPHSSSYSSPASRISLQILLLKRGRAACAVRVARCLRSAYAGLTTLCTGAVNALSLPFAARLVTLRTGRTFLLRHARTWVFTNSSSGCSATHFRTTDKTHAGTERTAAHMMMHRCVARCCARHFAPDVYATNGYAIHDVTNTRCARFAVCTPRRVRCGQINTTHARRLDCTSLLRQDRHGIIAYLPSCAAGPRRCGLPHALQTRTYQTSIQILVL
jgi:hypothetical protein